MALGCCLHMCVPCSIWVHIQTEFSHADNTAYSVCVERVSQLDYMYKYGKHKSTAAITCIGWPS